MTNNFAQTTNTGASNAEDFQPPTANPQQMQGQNLQQQQGNLQGGDGSQDALDQNDAQITVPSGSASSGQPELTLQETTASSDYLGIIIGLTLVVLLVIVIRQIARKMTLATEPSSTASAPVATATTPTPAKKKTATPKKSKPTGTKKKTTKAKKKSKTTKRKKR